MIFVRIIKRVGICGKAKSLKAREAKEIDLDRGNIICRMYCSTMASVLFE